MVIRAAQVRQWTTVMAISALAAVSAHATPMLSVSSEGSSAASAAETDFLVSLASYQTESFEDFTAGPPQATTMSTSVGDFSMDLAGVGGQCDAGAFNCNAGLAVLDSATTPFNGRFAVDGNQWLDSMDAQEMRFSPLAGTTALGFYITDPNDAGGRLSVGGLDFSFDNIFGSALANGRLFYVTISNAAGLGDLVFYSNNRDDGFGLDNVTIAQVPEPGTLTLLGAGLLGLIMLRRRQTVAR